MSRESLEEQKYQIIKAAIIDPDNNPLPDYMRSELERVVAAAKILEKNPVQKNAVALLKARFPEASRTRLYEDCRRAMRLFNSTHTFDYDFWQYWLLQDIAELMQRARDQNDFKAWAAAQKNLIAAMGERPDVPMDAKLIEKHEFNVVVQVNGKPVNIGYDAFMKLPADARKVLTDALDQPIEDVDAEDIMNS